MERSSGVPLNYKVNKVVDLDGISLLEIGEEVDKAKYVLRGKFYTASLTRPLDYIQIWYHFRTRFPDKGNIPHRNKIEVAQEFDDEICKFESLDPLFDAFVGGTSVPRFVFFMGHIYVEKVWSRMPVFVLRYDGEEVLGIALWPDREHRDIKILAE